MKTTISPKPSSIKKPQIATPGINPKNNPKKPAKVPPTKNNTIHIVVIIARIVVIQNFILENLSKTHSS